MWHYITAISVWPNFAGHLSSQPTPDTKFVPEGTTHILEANELT